MIKIEEVLQSQVRSATPLAHVGQAMIKAIVVMAMALPSAASACGACIEDNVAATYDHSVIHAAIKGHDQVVFVALEGRDAPRIGRLMTNTAPTIQGLRRGTLRYTSSPPALSFALAKEAVPDQAVMRFTNAVKGLDVRMRVIRMLRDGVLVDPTTSNMSQQLQRVDARQ